MATFYPPLPPGWEARWDSNQKAYFYIDHKNKATSWEDPRFFQAKQAPAASGQSIAMHDLSHRSPGPLPSSSRQPSCQPSSFKASTQGSETSDQTRRETSFTNKQNADLEKTAATLRTRFPDAAPIIMDVLNMCGGDLEQASTQLRELGMGTASPSHHASHSAAPAHGQGQSLKAGARTTARTGRGSPKNHQSSASSTPTKRTKTAAPHKSDVEKQSIQSKLCGEFKDLEPEVVRMAMEACDYDEGKARGTLARVAVKWTSASDTQNPSMAEIDSPMPKATALPAAPTSQSLEPVSFSLTQEESVSPPKPRGTSNVKVTQQTAEASGLFQLKKKEQQQHAKQVTNPASAECQPGNEVVTSQPQPRSQPQQPHRKAQSQATPAVGSADLAKGQDPTLRMGPNHFLYTGPNPSLVSHGHLRAEGPNPAFHHGNMADLASGSCGAEGSNPALRCSTQHRSPAVMTASLLHMSV